MLPCKFGNGLLGGGTVKKIATFVLAALASFALTSCLTTNMKNHGAFELSESPKEAMERVVAYEKADDYLYKFKAVNWGGAECEVTLYDERYMKVVYPQIETPFFYCYKFVGDCLDYSERKGVFGHAVNFTTGKIEEFVFRSNFHGGYKFKSIADDMAHDKKWKDGRITWETNSHEAREQGIQHYIYFFAARDKTLDSKRNSAGGKRDIAGTLYFSLAEKSNMHPSFNGNL